MEQSNLAVAENPDTQAQENLEIKVIERIEKFGAGTWELLHKESAKSDGWAETTKAMEIMGVGVVVKTTVTQRDESGLEHLALATVFIPNVAITRHTEAEGGIIVGRSLVPFAKPSKSYAQESLTPEDEITKPRWAGKKPRGRPPGSTSATKRGPGRPKAVAASKTEKRGPGRPKGSTNVAKRGPGRPKGSGKKRGPGRPKGSKNK